MLSHPSTFLATLLSATAHAAVDLDWHAPTQTDVNNITTAFGGNGVYGFIFNSSNTPVDKYGTYNWCNMPHVRKTEYIKPSADYSLKYVEVIHRHHKRTPYASNAFPVEPYHWDCDDQGLYYYGQHLPAGSGNLSAHTYWDGYNSSVNPFVPSGWIGSCQFPQITSGGLDDSWAHGADLYGVYHDLLDLLPDKESGDWQSKVKYRVTTNQITSQVAGMLIAGMWGAAGQDIPLLAQASTIDSLEPAYSCAAGSALFSNIKSSSNAAWADHLTRATDLYAALDAVSGVPADDAGFHSWFDHYYDNLSARQCHGKPLPCNATSGDCITQAQADEVYRLGQWEYSQIYRDAGDSLAASVATYGVWVAELAAHLRAVVEGQAEVVYWHNVAHDGSLSRLLSILQIEQMVWPGMGSEVVFELWQKSGGSATAASRRDGSGSGFYARVLFSGQTLRSSNPSLGVLDMVPVETLLAYFDGLVGQDASLVKAKCTA
ncbi:histidine acid phosphatase [Truncatella angustata]|uniref:Histidine acid phosphatase n=1 Tax=Truncatella angustata TaxID=152316 RepID=A0A9P8UA99_9PEZI|nr:histidine acid phosphatase [Truncatella angustata]KAH6640052.1 histidine acid phosphatase [Truncatella angustata]